MEACTQTSSTSSGKLTVSLCLLQTLTEGTDSAIPKPQRQGAIIILGMLAVAKREVVTERVDLLLKIGLGNLGMVS